LTILIVKNLFFLQFVKNNRLKIFNIHLCPRIVFPSRKKNFNELMFGLKEKTKQLYVLLALIECHFTTASLDMWMSKARHFF